MPNKVKQETADTAYDSNYVYNAIAKHCSHVDIVIPPRKNATDENIIIGYVIAIYEK